MSSEPEKRLEQQSGIKKSWICIRCGYIHDGEVPPQYCPICQASSDDFVEDTQENRDKLAHVLADKY